jgi:hypothetical protein
MNRHHLSMGRKKVVYSLTWDFKSVSLNLNDWTELSQYEGNIKFLRVAKHLLSSEHRNGERIVTHFVTPFLEDPSMDLLYGSGKRAI